MGPVTQRFRAALGGFNRRDVMAYIEQSAAAHHRRVSELEQRLARAEQERDDMRQEADGLRSQQGDLAAEEARVRSSLEESTEALARLRGELSQTETKLGVAREELKRMQEKVAELAPMAERYEQLKDRVATVELDAHRKAQATIDEAQAQVDALREQARQWTGQVLEQHQALCQGVQRMLEQAREVAAMEQSLAQAQEQAQALLGKVEAL